MVEMRDGVRLYTGIYAPADTLRHPILLFRNTYGSGPYGEEWNSGLWNDCSDYLERGYIMVFQDVRGLRMSEGEFENVRPVGIYNEKGANDATDMYDTADWLIKNTNSNGNIGVSGCSYGGFTAMVAGLSGHPAVKAIVPQAPVTDWFLGDDFHHNGVFMPAHAFGFLSGFGLPRHKPHPEGSSPLNYYYDDEYSFYLRNRALPKLTALLGDSIAFWPEMMRHPDYDTFWKGRNPLENAGELKPAVLTVGGIYDAEDLYGTVETYRRLSTEFPSADTYFLFGPWSHGGWGGDGYGLAALRFGGERTADVYKKMQLDFLDNYLAGTNPGRPAKATVFTSGDNKWHEFGQWPPENVEKRNLYLDKGSVASFAVPGSEESFSSYISDPSHPVPYTNGIFHSTGGDYMVEDQRFAARRPDVLTFVSDTLASPLTLTGPLEVAIWMSSSTDDADVVVKLIDVYPETFAYSEDENPGGEVMGSYQQLVRGDIMAAHYREGFDHRVPLTPGEPTMVSFKMPDVSHTFMQGHRIMVQIQSSWFPLFRMSPQRFVNEYEADDSQFQHAEIKIYHSEDYPSHLVLPVLD